MEESFYESVHPVMVGLRIGAILSLLSFLVTIFLGKAAVIASLVTTTFFIGVIEFVRGCSKGRITDL